MLSIQSAQFLPLLKAVLFFFSMQLTDPEPAVPDSQSLGRRLQGTKQKLFILCLVLKSSVLSVTMLVWVPQLWCFSRQTWLWLVPHAPRGAQWHPCSSPSGSPAAREPRACGVDSLKQASVLPLTHENKPEENTTLLVTPGEAGPCWTCCLAQPQVV